MAKAIHRCMAKATKAEGDGVGYSFNWAVARRGILQVRPDSLACSDWVIPYSEIDEAVLYSVRQMLIPGFVLVIKSQGVTYQFGLNWGRFWTRDLPFPVRRERAQLGYSWYSIAVRMALIAMIAYWFWRRTP